MAKRNRQTIVTDGDEDEEGADPALEVDELSQVLGELDSAGAVTIKVERMREGKRPEYVGDMSPSGFTLAQLQERFGGGEYALTVLDSARRYVKRTTVAVAPPLKPATPAPAEATGMEKLAQAITAQLQQQGQLLQLLVLQSRLGGGGAAVTNPDPATMRRQLLEEMQLMKGIIGGGQSVGPDKVLELVMKGMEIAKETAGAGGDSWPAIAGKAIDVLGEPLAQLVQAQALAPAPAMTSQPGSGVAVGAEASALPRPQLKPVVNPMFKQYLSFLIGKAAADADPALYADLILDNVPEHLVRQFLADADPVAKLAAFDARVSQHAEWFRDLGRACMELLNAHASGPGAGSPAADGDAGSDS